MRCQSWVIAHCWCWNTPAGETLALNIFEPRYRLLVRRVMQTSRRFGMATVHGSGHQLSDVACECEILDCQPQHDG